jgi:hypothetical protein
LTTRPRKIRGLFPMHSHGTWGYHRSALLSIFPLAFRVRANFPTGNHLLVDVFPPRHSARPFHHTRSSIACLHPPHPPITQAPAALPPASERLPSPLPPFPRPSFSPPLRRPPLLPCVVQWTMINILPARVLSGPREHQRRARSGDVSGSTGSIVCRY